MNARNIIKALALALALALAFASTTSLVGCTERIIIEEPEQEGDSQRAPHLTAVANHDGTGGEVANQALYVRSGTTDPGEQESGPFPQPWQSRLGPFPQPWQRDTDDSDDGKTPPPPSDPNPDPDPNPKP